MNKNKITGWIVLACALIMTGCVSGGSIDDNVSEIEASRYNTQAATEYFRQGRIDSALEKAVKAVEQDDENADAQLIYAMILERRGDPEDLDDVEDAYERAIDLSPDNPGYRNNYGSFLCKQEEYRDAIRQFRLVAEHHRYQRPEAAWTNAGTCAMRIPDLDRAEDFLRKALDINRQHAPALWQMAQLMLEKENALAARAFLQRLEAMGKLPAEALWLGVRIERSMNDEAAARRYADILLRDYPESREAALVMESRGDSQ